MILLRDMKPLLIALLLCCTTPLWAAAELPIKDGKLGKALILDGESQSVKDPAYASPGPDEVQQFSK